MPVVERSPQARAAAALSGTPVVVEPAAGGFGGGSASAAVAVAAGAAAAAAAGGVSRSALWDEVARGKVEPDDLRRIRGVDADTERRLKEFGVSRYQDIANWSATDVGRFATVLGTGSRIDSERWIDQAKILARGEETEFARSIRLGKLGASGVAAASAAAVAAAAVVPQLSGDGRVESATARALAEAELVGSRINKMPDGDDLTLIRGIGPSLRSRLQERGIIRFGQLGGVVTERSHQAR